MKKLTGTTPDLTKENVDKIAELFPQVVTEIVGEDGAPARSVDFDLLRQLLSDSFVDGPDERYRLDWPGKRAALLKANTPLAKTLRPDYESSVDFDTTQNLFIEGDNFEALKILQESYLGKVKMIYIDPPYNTGKDFVYSDNFTQYKAEYNEEIEAVDEEGNKMFKENTRTNPRFHSDWLSMMYERLTIARDLLRDDGVVFISIDDNEVHNLRKMCDEIFGESNVEQYVWDLADFEESSFTKTASHTVRREHEYIIACFRSEPRLGRFIEYRFADRDDFGNPDNDPRGDWMSGNISRNGITSTTGSKYFTIKTPTGVEYIRNWTVSQEEFNELVSDNRIFFSRNGDGVPRLKIFKSEASQSIQSSIFKGLKTSITGKNQIKELFDRKVVFDFPKPINFIKRFTEISTVEDSLVLDFFSGSGPTAHAVMQQNAEDGGNRKFIMVQLPEETPADSEARKAGYENIAQLGRERIRRAAAKIREDLADKIAERPEDKPLDTGFRAFKVADTAFLDVERHPAELEQGQLLELADNIKTDRTPADLLTQVMLELGLTLDLPIETKQVGDNTVFYVAHNALVACFDEDVPLTLIDEMVKVQPLQVAFKDAGFGSDDALINAETHLKRLSPDTILSVI